MQSLSVFIIFTGFFGHFLLYILLVKSRKVLILSVNAYRVK
nr:MAG TPA: hypothetical protein [Caudoviricetes sp.]